MRKLVVTVVDGLKPSMLERAVATGRAPVLARLMRDGVYVDDCVAAFPSVTPVCTATIATGVGQDEHRIPSMNWFHRGERRYVEYGSSLPAARRFGIGRQLVDTVYNLNLAHLSRQVPTMFELLDDADVRTAGTTWLIYRGRHRHEARGETALAQVVTAVTPFRHAVYGPRELFYADIFASRRTGCRSQFGMPGVRDQHTGCVGAYLVERDLFDFLLFSLPDNDTHSHRNGPHAQVESIAEADRQIERLVAAGGGIDAFLATHAMIVLGDHSHAPVERRVALADAFADWRVLGPLERAPGAADIALCPSQRAGMVYVLDPDERERLTPRLADAALAAEGVDLCAWLAPGGGEGVVRSARGELRFAPGGELQDVRGGRWSVAGDRATLELRIADGRVRSAEYPDALQRLWSALRCPGSGDVLLSAAPGYEFIDWGGVDHVGGGSHGSLHHSDSLGALLWCGTGPGTREVREQWSLRDVVPLVREHFGV